ncbi:MAG: alpha/beta fold hydrolase [Ferrovibrionaceae bacterium]
MSTLALAGGPIDYVWAAPPAAGRPTLVFLHEGLGSISLWRDFPAAVGRATGCGVLVYSRYGYGNSAPCPLPRPLDYMHVEAREVLPELLDRLAIGPHVLVGHSDGASIALIHAGSAPRPGLIGVAVMAPHVFVEEVATGSIAMARVAWETGDLRDRLARHHADVDTAFRGWNDAWLDPRFRAWNIEEFLPHITVPVLALQGEGDEYGTAAQVETVARVTGGDLVLLPDCGHSPHRDQPQATLTALSSFINQLPARLPA